MELIRETLRKDKELVQCNVVMAGIEVSNGGSGCGEESTMDLEGTHFLAPSRVSSDWGIAPPCQLARNLNAFHLFYLWGES
jgi:hypothetical protein